MLKDEHENTYEQDVDTKTRSTLDVDDIINNLSNIRLKKKRPYESMNDDEIVEKFDDISFKRSCVKIIMNIEESSKDSSIKNESATFESMNDAEIMQKFDDNNFKKQCIKIIMSIEKSMKKRRKHEVVTFERMDEDIYDTNYIKILDMLRDINKAKDIYKDRTLSKNIVHFYFSKLYYNHDYNDIKQKFELDDDVGRWYYWFACDYVDESNSFPDFIDDNFGNEFDFTTKEVFEEYLDSCWSLEQINDTDDNDTKLNKEHDNNIIRVNAEIIFKKMLARSVKDKEEDLNDPNYVYEDPGSDEDYTTDEESDDSDEESDASEESDDSDEESDASDEESDASDEESDASDEESDN